MWGLKLRLECPYFAVFRKPTTTSLILTYIIPPYTTIRGMFSNAMGLPRDDLRIQDWYKIGIKLIHVERSRELAKVLKLKGTGKKYQKTYPSAPMFREFLVEPKYEIFVVGEKDRVIGLYEALLNPQRSLYLGSSDDVVDLDVSEPFEVFETVMDETNSVVEGIYKGCIVEKIPYRFLKNKKSFDVEFKTVSVPIKNPIKGNFKGFNFGRDENIWVI